MEKPGRWRAPSKTTIKCCRHFLAGRTVVYQHRKGLPSQEAAKATPRFPLSTLFATTRLAVSGLSPIVPDGVEYRTANPNVRPSHTLATHHATTTKSPLAGHRSTSAVVAPSSPYLIAHSPSAAARAAQTSSTTLSLPQTTWPLPGLRTNSSFRSPRTTPRAWFRNVKERGMRSTRCRQTRESVHVGSFC